MIPRETVGRMVVCAVACSLCACYAADPNPESPSPVTPTVQRVGSFNGVGPGHSNPSHLYVWDSGLFFAANDGLNGSELWSSDGSDAGIPVNHIAGTSRLH